MLTAETQHSRGFLRNGLKTGPGLASLSVRGTPPAIADPPAPRFDQTRTAPPGGPRSSQAVRVRFSPVLKFVQAFALPSLLLRYSESTQVSVPPVAPRIRFARPRVEFGHQWG